MNSLVKIVSVGILAMSFAACNKSKSDDPVKTGNVALKFVPGATGASADDEDTLNPFSAAFYEDLAITTGTGAGLQSLKVYFREIKLCTEVTFNSGTGYGSSSCVSVYDNNAADTYTGTSAPTAADRATFQAAGEGKYFDVLSATDRASLSRSVALPVGTYKYGIIETHPWVKIKAQAGTLCTKATGNTELASTGGDGIVTYRTTNANLTCAGVAEEALVYITNANSTIAFTKPFEVAEGASVEVDLALNLDKEIKATINASGDGSPTYNVTGSASMGFFIPMLKMSPAPRLAGTTTKTETYFLANSTLKDVIRVVLYYNSDDATKSVLGANATVIKAANSNSNKGNKPVYAYNVSQTGNVISFTSWDNSAVMSFTRFVSGTPTLNCASGSSGGLAALEDCNGASTTWSYPAPTIGNL